jgi:hypothetical protein
VSSFSATFAWADNYWASHRQTGIPYRPTRARFKYPGFQVRYMTERNSDLKPGAGRTNPHSASHSVPAASPELVRTILTALALKNSELLSCGRTLGNRPTPVWYQHELHLLGTKASLLSLRRNLRHLCQVGILQTQCESPGVAGSGNCLAARRLEKTEYVLTPAARTLLFSKVGLRVSFSLSPKTKEKIPDNTVLRDLILSLKSKLGR